MLRRRLASWCLFALFCAPAARAQNWAAPARELADKIVAQTQSRSAVFLTVRNASSLDASDASEIRRAIESQLRALGVRLVGADQAVDEVRITLSENATQLVWVAESGRGDARDVAIVSLPSRGAPSAAPGDLLVIRRAALIAQPTEMLDVVQISGPPAALLVLDAVSVKLYQQDAGGWKLAASAPLQHDRPWPRDLRGRLAVEAESFTAYLPATECSGQWTPLLTATCRASDDPWPLAPARAANQPAAPASAATSGTSTRAFFNASRNFFTGVTSPPIVADPAPFYSAARLNAPDGAAAWVLAGIDGNTRVLNSTGQAVATVARWGSDVAAVTGGCGGAQYLLASAPGSDRSDSVHVYQVAGRRVSEVAPPLDLPGSVTELWTAPGGAAAIAIVRNQQTRDYEASSLIVACGR